MTYIIFKYITYFSKIYSHIILSKQTFIVDIAINRFDSPKI